VIAIAVDGVELDVVRQELAAALRRAGCDAHVTRDRVTWRPSEWAAEVQAVAKLRADGGRVVVEVEGLEPLLERHIAGWAGRLVAAATSNELGDWLTDRWARRPYGAASRDYADPTSHLPSFGAVLAALELRPDDHLLELGCGGGAFLRRALETGCRAAAVDHSEAMVELACATNADAVACGDAEIVLADAAALPFDDESFTAVATMQTFFFFADPLAVLQETRRVLASGGRLAVFTVAPELRRTMAAPEPMASRGRFYEDDELAALARKAGFDDVSVTRPDLEPHARAAGLPDDVVSVFAGERGGQLLVGRRR